MAQDCRPEMDQGLGGLAAPPHSRLFKPRGDQMLARSLDGSAPDRQARPSVAGVIHPLLVARKVSLLFVPHFPRRGPAPPRWLPRGQFPQEPPRADVAQLVPVLLQ